MLCCNTFVPPGAWLKPIDWNTQEVCTALLRRAGTRPFTHRVHGEWWEHSQHRASITKKSPGCVTQWWVKKKNNKKTEKWAECTEHRDLNVKKRMAHMSTMDQMKTKRSRWYRNPGKVEDVWQGGENEDVQRVVWRCDSSQSNKWKIKDGSQQGDGEWGNKKIESQK